ncbi:MAG: hypothetical protein NC213_06595 [Acetobacter sp.]|nr:hypothetical protein [Bacteroides sp.]MCM1341394.1 hypothetical protein [Acetobacter sp.]MCM1433488.1 hypothetical protein [Clostridiales bacterium]
MIVRLNFDMFYTIIKVADISEKELKKGLYNQFEKWLKKQKCYTEKTGMTTGLSYDDTAVIQWLKETKFINSNIEILEKHKNIDEQSSYNFDLILYF